jgi:hypothetical protein
MGLFNKLFGKSDKSPQQEVQKSQQQALPPCKSEQELMEHYGALSFEKQLEFGEIIRTNQWNVDMNKGEISFGPDLTFPIQVLGTFSHSSETWLWAWANTQSGLPQNLLQQALQLKNYGEEHEIDLLRNSEFDATNQDLHLIGLIASGMFNASSYYIADYGQGAMVVTIKSAKIERLRRENHQQILTIFSQFISQYDMNHKPALTNYLTLKGYAVSSSEYAFTATKKGNTITAKFDTSGRLAKLNG